MARTKKTQKVNEPIVRVRDLLIEFGNGKKKVKAVKGVTFDVFKGETFGLVGESGSGKTTVGRAVMGIQPVSDGTIYFNGKVAYGQAPNLFKLNQSTMNNLEKMKINQNNATVRLNDYLNEFKRVYYKYVEGKYYDLKTKELRDYTDNRSRKIKEGRNLKGTKVISNKKDVNLTLVKDAIEDNLKRLLKIIRIQQKTSRFISGISNHIDISKKLEKALNDYHYQTSKLVIGIKELENKIYKSLDKIIELRKAVLKGEYTSISLFFNEFGDQIKQILDYHKSISTLVDLAIDEQKINLVLTSPKSKRSNYIKELKKQIEIQKEKNNSLTQKEFDQILKLAELKNINDAIGESDLFKTPTNSQQRDLKRQMQMIFQDPASSLNDRMAIEEIIGEGLDNFPKLYKNEQSAQLYVDWVNSQQKDKKRHIELKDVKYKDVKHFLILQLLTTVGMLPEHLSRYPHEFSGGQRQRIGIARALIMKPSFIVADEPISALDVSIRAQVMNLLSKFQKEFDLTYIFIAHDLSVVRFVANRIAVIYRGDIVELAEADELFFNPLHPYTKSLLSAVPLPDPEQEKNKVHYEYKPEEEHFDYLVDFPQWTEIKNGHFVYANSREAKEYEKQYSEYEKTKK